MNNLNTQNPNNYHYKTKEVEIHILGGLQINKMESLRVTLSIEKSHLPTASSQREESNTILNILRQSLDLYNDTTVEKFIRKCAERLEIGTNLTRRTLQELTRALENHRFAIIDKSSQSQKPKTKQLTKTEKDQAIKFLKSKNLLEKTNELIGKSGVIGEINNRLLMYLIFTSRKTKNPLHAISLGSSGTGKTHLQSKVAELIPNEDKIEITVLSANAFYYFNRTELANKLILIEDLDGAQSVLYPLRELQSKKRITKTVVHKNNKGESKTIHLTVEGPVCVAGCTTQESIYEDNSNRSFLLYIDESQEQDIKIMNYQRLLSAGKIDKEDEEISAEILRNVQRILKPIKVINPFAEFLELPQSVFKPRRTNSHYLQFIEAITFYCQWQRQKKYDESTGEEYIETEIEDIEQANELIHEVLLRKSDELNGATRNYLENVKNYIEQKGNLRFTAREIRRTLRIKKTTQWRYHKQLFDSYLLIKDKKKGENKTYYKLNNHNGYKELQAEISKALDNCIAQIKSSIVPACSTIKTERLTKSKPAN